MSGKLEKIIYKYNKYKYKYKTLKQQNKMNFEMKHPASIGISNKNSVQFDIHHPASIK